MPQSPYSVELEIDIPVLDAISSGLPAGEPAAGTEKRSAEGIVLENELLSATFVPAFGGRLISLLDKTTGHDLLGDLGLEFSLDGGRRANAFGPVRASITDEGLRTSEVGVPGGVGLDITASVGEDAVLAVSVAFRNRTLEPVRWNPGWIAQGRILPVGQYIYASQIDAGIALVELDGPSARGFEGERILPPRWGGTFCTQLVPFAGIGHPAHVTPVAALGLGDAHLTLQPRCVLLGAKLVLQTPGGKTLEAPADLSPGTTLTYSYDELGGRPTAFAILDSERLERFRYPVTRTDFPPPAQAVYPEAFDLSALEIEPAYRYWVANLRTRDAFRLSNFAEADAQAETALLFNGDDHLAWIEKAVAARHLGVEDSEAPELLNAHYLAPLEPLLRAEAFLSQSGVDASAFLGPLAELPHELTEVACFYLERGLMEDAARFLDGALTVSTAPMLRLLFAYVCLSSERTRAEAATAVQAMTQFGPPYPWRSVEHKALVELSRTFPANPILEQFSAIAGR